MPSALTRSSMQMQMQVEQSLTNFTHVIPSSYQAMCMIRERVNFGWFDYRNVCFVELSLCTVFGHCLQFGFYIHFTNVIQGCYK